MTNVMTDAEVARWLERREGVPSVWARYTDLVVERGEGSWIETIDGERYLDYTCGIGVTNTGHAHPRVAAAIAEQAARIVHAHLRAGGAGHPTAGHHRRRGRSGGPGHR